MPNNAQPYEFDDIRQTVIGRNNISELRRQLSSIFSRDNLGLRYRSVSADTTLTNKDSVVAVDTSGGSKTITLPYANTWTSNRTTILTIVKTSASNTLTVAPQGSDTLNYWSGGGSTLVTGNITTAGILQLISDGSSKWYVVSGIGASVAVKYAVLSKTADQSGISTDTLITWSTSTLDGFTISSNVLTCSSGSAGLYRIDVAMPFINSTTAAECYFGFKQNSGTTYYPFGFQPEATGAGKNNHGTFYRYLADNDTIEFRGSAAAGTVNYTAGGTVTLTRVA